MAHNISRIYRKGGVIISIPHYRNPKSGKKIIIFLLVLGIIASTLCVTIGSNRQQVGFSPRLSAPMIGNHYYYSDNIFYQSGFGIPNCTAYAWGRAYEITGEYPKLSTSDAGKWFAYNAENKIYSYGTEPHIGAIACFDNNQGGHVAVVEKIQGDTITFSNSAYGGKEFYLSTAKIYDDNPGQRGWIFQGYIYLGNYEENTSSSNSYYKVLANSGLNLREYPTTSSNIVVTIPENTQVFVTEICFSDRYVWGYTNYRGNYGYCALDYADKLF